jgi:PIN domain nuclease of toxin-antitoxin system
LTSWGNPSEPGADRVEAVLDRSSASAVNSSEVLHKSIDRGVDVSGMINDLLALGDRACLALALRSAATAMTADQTLKRISAGITIQFLR